MKTLFDRSICEWRRLFATAVLLLAAAAMPDAHAGATIINGSECIPYTGTPGATSPIVYPSGNRLYIFRNGADRQAVVSCNFPNHSDSAALETGNISLAIVDGTTLDDVRLCYGTYYSDAISCGPASSGSEPAIFVTPPATTPGSATAPFILMSTFLTTSRTPMRIRSYTGFWSAP